MKKIFLVFMMAVLCLNLAACSNTPETENNTADTGANETADTGANEQAEDTGTNEQAAETGTEEKGGSYRVGFAVYNLTNPVWSELVEEAQRYGKEMGLDITYADAGQDSEKQISQLENFIQSSMDAIVILAIDVAAVEPVAKKAMDEGIFVVDYCRGLENAHTSLELDPDATGKALANMAKEWIDEHYAEDEAFKWAHLDIPTVELGVLEGAACEEEMKKILPNSELVANAGTLTVEEGMKNTESILQANPDLRVILGLSAGSGVGGNEAIKAAISPDQYEEYGLFSIDATEQEVLSIINKEVLKGSISLGSGKLHAQMLIDYVDALLKGEEVERVHYMPIEAITEENAQEFYDATYK